MARSQVAELVAVGYCGGYWVARAPWSAVCAQGRSFEEVRARIADAVAMRRALSPPFPVPDGQVMVEVDALRGMALPPLERLATSGAAVQRALQQRGLTMPTQSRHHVALRDRASGRVVVVPLVDELAAPTLADLARQAGLEHGRLLALL